MSYTKGIWKIANGGPFRGYVEIFSDKGLELTIAQAKHPNAQLIATAPELLEALQELVKAHDQGMGKSALDLMVELARDAINKATL